LPRRSSPIHIFAAGRSLEKAVTQLRALPGIGEWTAQYIALRQLREPDAFPAADVGLMREMADEEGVRPSAGQLLIHAEQWLPWRAYAAQHLWTSARAQGRCDRTAVPATTSHDNQKSRGAGPSGSSCDKRGDGAKPRLWIWWPRRKKTNMRRGRLRSNLAAPRLNTQTISSNAMSMSWRASNLATCPITNDRRQIRPRRRANASEKRIRRDASPSAKSADIVHFPSSLCPCLQTINRKAVQ
jgi:hypothetical protein